MDQKKKVQKPFKTQTQEMVTVYKPDGSKREFEADIFKQMEKAGQTYGWQRKAVAPEEVQKLQQEASIDNNRQTITPEQQKAQELEAARVEQLKLKDEAGVDSTTAAQGKGLGAANMQIVVNNAGGDEAGTDAGTQGGTDAGNTDGGEGSSDPNDKEQGDNAGGKGQGNVKGASKANAAAKTSQAGPKDGKAPNAGELAQKIYAAKSAKEINALVSKDEHRATVIKARDERLAQLNGK